MENRIFVSYSRSDGNFALKLAKDLRSANVGVWIDQLDIRTGDTWDKAVEDALKACTGILVVLSPKAVISRSVLDEVSFALEENKRILPIIFEQCELPFRLRRVQHIDFTDDYSTALGRLLDSLGQENAVGDHGHSRDSSRKQRIVAAAWTALIGCVVTGFSTILIYSKDPRDVLTPTFVIGGSLFAGLLWGVGGAVAGSRRLLLLWGISFWILVLVLWIAVYGTYADVVWTAVIVGAPVGGIAGVLIGKTFHKKRIAA